MILRVCLVQRTSSIYVFTGSISLLFRFFFFFFFLPLKLLRLVFLSSKFVSMFTRAVNW